MPDGELAQSQAWLGLTHNSPCSNKMTLFGPKPKNEFLRKKSSVSRRVGPLVITYHGITTVPEGLPACSSATVCNLAMRSA